MTGLVRDPLTYFLVLGAALFGLYAVARPVPAAMPAAIHLDRAELRALAADYQARWGRLPSAAEMQQLIERSLRQELLYRQALARDLHQQDQAFRINLGRRLQAQWEEAARRVRPTGAQLRSWLESHPGRYRQPWQLTLSHRFFSNGGRGPRAQQDARRALDRLRHGGDVADDGFDGAKTLTLRSRERLQARFGPAFADAVLQRADAGEQQRWFGPVPSAAGWHLVRIDEVRSARALTFAEARPRLERDWQEHYVAAETARRIDELRRRFVTRVDGFGSVEELVAQ